MKIYIQEERPRVDSLVKVLVMTAEKNGVVVKRAEYGKMVEMAMGDEFYSDSKIELFANKLTSFEGRRIGISPKTAKKIDLFSIENKNIKYTYNN